MATTNGHIGPSRIVAIEEEEPEDFIPGPPPSSSSRERQHSGGASVGSSGGGRSRGSLISRVLNISGKRANHNNSPTVDDGLQLSQTDHGEYMAGSGILASREDLNMAPEACTYKYCCVAAAIVAGLYV